MAKQSFLSTFKGSMHTMMHLLSYTKGNRVQYFTGMVLASGRGFIQTVIFSFGIYWILDAAQTGDLAQTLRIGMGTLMLCVLLVAAYALGAWMLDCGVVKTSARVRLIVMRHMTRLPAAWYDQHHTGDIMSRMLVDFDNGMQNSLNMPIQETLNLLMSGIGSIIAIFTFDWRIALLLIAISLLALLVTSRFVVPSRHAAEDARHGEGKVAERLSDIIASAPVLRVHSLYNFVLSLLHSDVHSAKGYSRKQGRIVAVQETFGQAVTLFVYIGVLTVGLVGITRGWINASALIAILQLSSGPIDLFVELGGVLVRLQDALAGADRVFEILDIPEERQDGDLTLKPDAPAVSASHVSFAYRVDSPILRNASLHVSGQEKVALMGESSGGKSTWLKLICGLYDVQEGEICVFGNDVAQTSRAQLRKWVCYVPQDPHLFIATIEENIALAKLGSTHEEIREAVRRAGAEEFIQELPGGYDYPVSERGANLSGGQRQRIALARAFLKNPVLLLLDEPTSALDMASEAYITAELGETTGQTMLVATHRPSLLQVMDNTIQV